MLPDGGPSGEHAAGDGWGDGQPKRRYDYHAFGWAVNPTNGNRSTVTGYTATDWSNPKFTGKQRDYESGLQLDYFLARYYSGAQGRFTSPDPENAGSDPYDPQSWNMYAYGRNNPLKYVDPDGLAYRVCQVDEKGKEFNCGTVSDDNRFENYAKAQGWQIKGGKLLDQSGNTVGAAHWFNPEPMQALITGTQRAAPVVNTLAGVTLGFVAGAGIVAAAPAAASASAFIPQIANFASKQAAKSAIASMGLPAAQASAAISAIARATATSSIQIMKQGQDVIVRIARAGANGYQVMESVIDQAGGKQVVQKAYDAANALVHYDPKK